MNLALTVWSATLGRAALMAEDVGARPRFETADVLDLDTRGRGSR